MDANQENNLLTSSDVEHVIEDLRSDNTFQLVCDGLEHLRNNNDSIMRMQGQMNPPPLENFSQIDSCEENIDNEINGHGDRPHTLESDMIKTDHDMKLDHLALVQNSMLPLEVPPNPFSPTGTIPCRDMYPGPYNFELLLNSTSSHRRSWVFSNKLNKVFIDMNKSLLVQFRTDQYINGLSVRALPVYSMDDYVSTPVHRCDIHILSEDVFHNAHTENPPMCFCADYQWVRHVVKSNHPKAIYEYDCDSDRHSVRVPLEVPQAGTDIVEVEYHFSCKTSCNRGMNRKPINVIFTLETERREVVGRFVLPVKICSCPKRDKEKEEIDAETRNRGTLNGFGPTRRRRASSSSEKQDETKKIKIENIAPQDCQRQQSPSLQEADDNNQNPIKMNGETVEQVMTNLSSQMSELINIVTKQQDAISELATKQLQLQNMIEPMAGQIRAICHLLGQGVHQNFN